VKNVGKQCQGFNFIAFLDLTYITVAEYCKNKMRAEVAQKTEFSERVS